MVADNSPLLGADAPRRSNARVLAVSAACVALALCGIVAAITFDDNTGVMLVGWSGGSYTGGTVVDPNLLRDPGEGAYAGSWGGALDTAQADDIAYSIFRNQAGPDHDTIGGYPDRGYTMGKPNPNPVLFMKPSMLAGWSGGSYTGGTVVDPNLLRDPGEGAYAGSWGGALDTAQADDIAYSIFRNQAGPDHDTVGGYPDRGYTMSKPNPNPQLLERVVFLKNPRSDSFFSARTLPHVVVTALRPPSL